MPQRPSDGVAPGLPEAGPQHLEALQQVGTGPAETCPEPPLQPGRRIQVGQLKPGHLARSAT